MCFLRYALTLVGFVFLLLLFSTGFATISIPDLQYGLFEESNPANTPSFLYKPFVESSATARLQSDTIIFVGDVLLARHVESLMSSRGNKYPFGGLRFSDFSYNPYVVGNFEASIPQVHAQTKNFNLRFSVDSSKVASLYEAGFTHMSLANNHSLDFGTMNYINTIDVLQNNNLATFGHPTTTSPASVSFIDLDTTTVALIGLHTLTAEPTTLEVRQVVHYAEQNSDFQVVYIHWGEEYVTTSNSKQQFIANQLVQAGVDLIIGHHPHVVQEIGYIDGVPILYSLGNYVFDQYFSLAVQTGLLVQLDFSQEPKIHLIPIQSYVNKSQPSLLSTEKHADFLHELSSISHPSLQTNIKKGFIALRAQVATSSEIAIMVQ